MMDPELQAMQKVGEVLTPLEPDARARVLRWAAEKFEVLFQRSGFSSPIAATQDVAAFADFATLFDAANPKSEPDRALVAAYWLQVCKMMGDWESQAANTELKMLGRPVSNITRALDANMDTVPRLVMQTMKSGSTRQARKKYRLTIEGIRRVQGMIAAISDAGDEKSA